MLENYSIRPIPRRGVEMEGSIKGYESFIDIDIPIATKFSIPLKELCPVRGSFVISDRVRTNIEYMSRDWLYVNIKLTPIWARQFPNDPKSPPAEQYWIEYSNAAIQLKKLYPKIAAIGFMNEPNMPYEASVPDYFGCWMLPNEAQNPNGFFNAGVRYGKFLKLVNTEVKKVFPDLIIISGELYCDYNIQPKVTFDFANGMMTEKPVYDYNGIHAYHWYYHILKNSYTTEMTDEEKNDVFRTYFVLAKNLQDVTGKRSIFTETSLLRKQGLPDMEGFRNAQKDWMIYLKENISNVDKWDNPVVSFMWYALINPWEWCGMLNYPSKTPRPVYNEFIV